MNDNPIHERAPSALMTSRDELADLAESLRAEGMTEAADDTLSIVRIIDTSLDRVGFRKKRLEALWEAVSRGADPDELAKLARTHKSHLRKLNRSSADN